MYSVSTFIRELRVNMIKVQYGEAKVALAQKYAFTKKSTIFTQSCTKLGQNNLPMCKLF